MRFFKDYAQQLEMESIGKQPNIKSIFEKTGQVIFGGFGSTAQHSYFQLLHQGTASACADIFTVNDYEQSNKLLFAQSQAQSNLLANGADTDLQDFEGQCLEVLRKHAALTQKTSNDWRSHDHLFERLPYLVNKQH